MHHILNARWNKNCAVPEIIWWPLTPLSLDSNSLSIIFAVLLLSPWVGAMAEGAATLYCWCRCWCSPPGPCCRLTALLLAVVLLLLLLRQVLGEYCLPLSILVSFAPASKMLVRLVTCGAAWWCAGAGWCCPHASGEWSRPDSVSVSSWKFDQKMSNIKLI